MGSTTLCANRNFFRAEPNFTLHIDRLANKVMVSVWQVMPQLAGETFEKLEGGSWEHSDLKGMI